MQNTITWDYNDLRDIAGLKKVNNMSITQIKRYMEWPQTLIMVVYVREPPYTIVINQNLWVFAI